MRIHVSIFAQATFAAAAFAMTLSADTSGLLNLGTEYSPSNEGFTITMPHGEASGDLSQTIPLGLRGRKGKGTAGRPTAEIEASRTKIKDGTTFTAASVGVPAQIVKELTEEKRGELYRNLFVSTKKGKITGEKEIKQGDWTGKEYAVDFSETKMRMQLYILDGFGFYAMTEAASEDRLKAKDINGFFKSFKLKEKEKE
jgi:hypothetical protein